MSEICFTKIFVKSSDEQIKRKHGFTYSQYFKYKTIETRVSVQGVESLWGDCRFIPADWGS